MPKFNSMNYLVMATYSDAILCIKESTTELIIANAINKFLDFISNFPLSQAIQGFPHLANSSVFLYELDVLFKNYGPLLNTV